MNINSDKKVSILIFASGNGSNAENLITYFRKKDTKITCPGLFVKPKDWDKPGPDSSSRRKPQNKKPDSDPSVGSVVEET